MTFQEGFEKVAVKVGKPGNISIKGILKRLATPKGLALIGAVGLVGLAHGAIQQHRQMKKEELK